MDLKSALKAVLKKAQAYDGLARGLHETTRAIEKQQAQLCILADDCDQPDYKKLIEALCSEKSVPLLTVEDRETLGAMSGLCKIDADGEPRKIGKCSSVVITDYGEEGEAHTVLTQHLKDL
eukprot:jgi/Astpho2/5421/fgenesh1_pm.00076_%23_6_t